MCRVEPYECVNTIPPIYIKGVKGHGRTVIKELVNRGGIDALSLDGNIERAVFYLNSCGHIRCAREGEPQYTWVIEHLQEIKITSKTKKNENKK